MNVNKQEKYYTDLQKKFYIFAKLLLRSHSPNDAPLEPQRNVSIAAVRGAVRPSNYFRKASRFQHIYIFVNGGSEQSDWTSAVS